MNIKRTKYLHDILTPIFYAILATMLSIVTCSNVGEGYVEMIAIAVYSFSAGIISIFIVVMLKQFSKKYSIIEVLFGIIPLILFEIVCGVIESVSLFGLLDGKPINFSNGHFAMSLTSLLSIIIVYGISISIKTKHNTRYSP